MTFSHRPVLLDEAVTALMQNSAYADQVQSQTIYLDGTFGRGGHTRKILEVLPKDGCLISTD